MNMSFSEKSAWFSFVLTLAVWGKYVFEIFQMGGDSLSAEEQRRLALSMMAYATIYMIIAETVFHIIVGLANPNDAKLVGDERDQTIASKATSPAYNILFVGVVITIVHLLVFEHFPDIPTIASIQIPYLAAHLLIVFALLSELYRFGYMIWCYRKEA